MTNPLSVYVSIPAFSLLPPSGGCSASSHDPEECVDVIALDGISTGRDHLVLGLTHWGGGGTATQINFRRQDRYARCDYTWGLTQMALSFCSLPFDPEISINAAVIFILRMSQSTLLILLNTYLHHCHRQNKCNCLNCWMCPDWNAEICLSMFPVNVPRHVDVLRLNVFNQTSCLLQFRARSGQDIK